MLSGWINKSGNQWRGPDGAPLTRTFNDISSWTERIMYQAEGADVANTGAANATTFISWATPETDEHYLNPDNNTTIVLPGTRTRWLVEGQARGLWISPGAGTALCGWDLGGVTLNADGRFELFGAGNIPVNGSLERVCLGGASIRVPVFTTTAACALVDFEVTVKLTPLNG